MINGLTQVGLFLWIRYAELNNWTIDDAKNWGNRYTKFTTIFVLLIYNQPIQNDD